MKLKVSTKSNVKKVAGSIAKCVRIKKENEDITIQSVGAGAVNQTVKSIGIAREYLKEDNLDISTLISFVDVKFGEKTETAILFTLEVKNV